MAAPIVQSRPPTVQSVTHLDGCPLDWTIVCPQPSSPGTHADLRKRRCLDGLDGSDGRFRTLLKDTPMNPTALADQLTAATRDARRHLDTLLKILREPAAAQ